MINLIFLSQQKISPVCSLTPNMNSHITRQAKGTSICLTVKESCMFGSREHKNKAQTLLQNARLMNDSAYQKRRIDEKETAYQVHFHICHSEERHWDSPDPLAHAC